MKVPPIVNVFNDRENNNTSSVRFWCGILFYFLWNTVCFSVEQNIEHIYFSIYKYS